ERILGAYPNDGILGEEGSERQGTTGYRWIIDPIDGTRSFVHGVPLYGVLLALEEEGGLPVLGVAYLPGLDEVVCAARDQGAYWNGRRARVRSPRELGEACVGYTGFECFSESDTLDALERVRKAAGLTRGWGDCYGHLLVATGRTDAMLDPIMADWDTSALLPIVEEAGGVFTDWQGERTHLGGSAISASSVELGARLVQIVAG
ncbi:MAG: inositol monophosphatase family protein, partial [Planctomycetota bacterium]